VLSTNDIESLNFDDQMEIEAAMFEVYGSRTAFNQNGMDRIEEGHDAHSAQLAINKGGESVPPMSASIMVRNKDNILVH